MSATAPSSAAGPDHSPQPWVVLKFGGTSVSRRDRWDTIGALIRQRAETEQAAVLVVVSALSGITNALLALIDARVAGDSVLADQRAEAIVTRHRQFAEELGLEPEAVLGTRFAHFGNLLADPRASAAPADWRAEVLAEGELLSSALGVAYLRAGGLDLNWIDSRDWLRAEPQPLRGEEAERMLANCDLRPDPDLSARLLGHGRLLLGQGFIVRAVGGGTALLGRGGSDTSATCFGAVLKALRTEIWTDVPGMFSANPRRVPEARLLARLDYEEAQEIASTGAKVLHPRCIHPCREAGVPIWIRDTDRPDLAGTVIAAAADSVPGVKAVSSRRGIVLVSMETIGMWQQVGFLADVFARFRTHGLSVDLIGSSEANVTVSLDPSDNLVSTNVLEALSADLAEVCRVRTIAPCAALTLVGRGMRSLLHRLSDVLAEFGRERVHLISQSSNDLNLTFVIDEALEDALLPRLHELLIGCGAMPVNESAVFGPSWRSIQSPPGARPSPWWQRQRARLLHLATAGTPRYVYDLATVRARAEDLLRVAAIDRRFYALKANPHPALLRVLAAAGFGFECVSLGELRHVFTVLPELAPDRVLFTPSFAPRHEYAEALARGVHVTIDNTEALLRWREMFAGRALLLRLDPGFGGGHHEKVRTGGRQAKFGLALDALPTFLAAARAAEVRIVGLHAHIGSGIHDAGHWREVYGRLAAIAEGIGTVAVIDIGGGLGVAYDPQAEPFDMAAYGQVLAEVKAAYPHYALWVEPGRYLVAEAGVLLLGVTQTVEKAGLRRIGVDAGMNAILRPALYDAWHEIVNLSRIDAPDGAAADVVGPICETGDVLGRRRHLPDATAEGDIVLLGHAGAYGASMANAYNLRPLPAEDVLDV